MMRHYELWDTETGNLMATFVTEAEALDLVREAIRAEGVQTVEGWALGWGDPHGEGAQIAEGADLADRARDEITTSPP